MTKSKYHFDSIILRTLFAYYWPLLQRGQQIEKKKIPKKKSKTQMKSQVKTNVKCLYMERSEMYMTTEWSVSVAE